MEGREYQQRDILKRLIVYSDHLIPAVQEIIKELRFEEREDTKDFLSEVINGINWEIEVYNHCASLINEKSSYIDKKVAVTAVKNLGISLKSGDSMQIASCLEEDFLPFLNKLALASKLSVERA